MASTELPPTYTEGNVEAINKRERKEGPKRKYELHRTPAPISKKLILFYSPLPRLRGYSTSPFIAPFHDQYCSSLIQKTYIQSSVPTFPQSLPVTAALSLPLRTMATLTEAHEVLLGETPARCLLA